MKVRLEKFLIDRIHPNWIHRLFPQGYQVIRRGRGWSDTPIHIFIPHSTNNNINFKNVY